MTDNKISRSKLKAIIKECLVEILQEGLSVNASTSFDQKSDVRSPVTESFKHALSRNTRNLPPPNQSPRRVSPLDMPATVKNNNRQNDSLINAVKMQAGGNKIMEGILADTAMTTLQAQLAGEGASVSAAGPRPSISQNEQFSGDPADVFGEEVASKWASLAFMDSTHKKNM